MRFREYFLDCSSPWLFGLFCALENVCYFIWICILLFWVHPKNCITKRRYVYRPVFNLDLEVLWQSLHLANNCPGDFTRTHWWWSCSPGLPAPKITTREKDPFFPPWSSLVSLPLFFPFICPPFFRLLSISLQVEMDWTWQVRGWGLRGWLIDEYSLFSNIHHLANCNPERALHCFFFSKFFSRKLQ